MRFTTLTGHQIDHELRESGIDRVEIIEGLYGGLLTIQADREHGEWSMIATWDDGKTYDYVLMHPIPGPH